MFPSPSPKYYLLDAAYFMRVTQYTAIKPTANLDWILYGKKGRQADKTGLFRYNIQYIGKDGVQFLGLSMLKHILDARIQSPHLNLKAL